MSYEFEFTQSAYKQYQYWIKKDKKILKKINELIKEVQLSPFE